LSGWLLKEGKIQGHVESWQDDVWDEERPGIVHRLDKGTSGAIVVAKDMQTHFKLSQMFLNREVKRFYWAVVQGHFSELIKKRTRTINDLLKTPYAAFQKDLSGKYSMATMMERDPKQILRFRVSNKGKKAITHFYCLCENENRALLELKLETGRTHQIRVHLSSLGLPIVGDTLYGATADERIFLHAHRMEFTHPWSQKEMSFEAPSETFQSYCFKQQLSLSSKFT
jgi:23S rRNA pseudouridine1911/1915/1917 synthase